MNNFQPVTVTKLYLGIGGARHDLKIALDNSKANQTYNTPALGTLVMLDAQVKWMNEIGGLSACNARSAKSSSILYSWAESREWATPFVSNPAQRSQVVGTIDIASQADGGVDANDKWPEPMHRRRPPSKGDGGPVTQKYAQASGIAAFATTR